MWTHDDDWAAKSVMLAVAIVREGGRGPDFLKAGGTVLAGFALSPRRVFSRSAVEVIEMRSDVAGSHVWFDPIGLYIDPGTTVRWIVRENVHTVTAYHPRNDHHALRIPEHAVPWDSGFLVHLGDHFDVTLAVPVVYAYFCAPDPT